jgi:gluconolactonase
LQDRGCLETFKAKTAGREWAMMKAFAASNKK